MASQWSRCTEQGVRGGSRPIPQACCGLGAEASRGIKSKPARASYPALRPAVMDSCLLSLAHACAPPIRGSADPRRHLQRSSTRVFCGSARSYQAACTAAPPVMGPRKRSSAMRRTSRPPAKRSSREAGRQHEQGPRRLPEPTGRKGGEPPRPPAGNCSAANAEHL
jgi:hypothetical protein